MVPRFSPRVVSYAGFLALAGVMCGPLLAQDDGSTAADSDAGNAASSIAVAPATQPASEGLFLDLGFDAACEQAKKSGRPVFIDFYTTWCAPCKQLDATTWRDPRVIALLREKTVPIKIDAQKQTDLAKRFNVGSYPLLLFIKPDGAELDRISGYRKADAFLAEAAASLEGKDAVARARDKISGKGANNATFRMEYGDALAVRGRHQEALDEFLWCFDHGLEHNRNFATARYTLLLPRILRMKQAYPPALQALEKRRDQIEQAAAGTGEFTSLQANDLATLNRNLSQPARTLDTFDKLRAAGGERAKLSRLLLGQVIEALLEAKRYEDVVEGAEETLTRFTVTLANYDKAAGGQGGEAGVPKSVLPAIKQQLVNQGSQFFEALVGAKRAEDAMKLAEQLTEFSPTSATYVSLIQHAVKAGDKEVARQVAQRGRQRLAQGEQTVLEQAVAAIVKDG